MTFGKISKVFAVLLLISIGLRAQEDFIEDEHGIPIPAPGGLFEDELEPLNDTEIKRPTPPPANTAEIPNPADSGRSDSGLNLPEPKKFTSTNRPSGRSLPGLPTGVDLPNRNEKVRMDFVQVEIEDVVKYFAERLRKKFIYDPTILSGKVTIVSPTEVTMQEAYGAFLSAMEVRGYVVYPAGAYLKIEKAANARKVPVPVYEGQTPNDDSYVTRILTLKFLLVRDISQAVRNLLSRTGGDLIEHAPTNTLIISDYAYNIRRIVRILDVLDIESFQEQIEIIPLRNAAAPDIARKVTEFFPTTGASGGAPAGGLPSGRLSRRSGGGESDSGVIQKVVADERTNCIIVLGSERGIEQVKKFIARIDVPTEGGGGQIHVYPIQNVKADEIATTLSALASGKKSSSANLIPTPPPLPGFPSTPVQNSPEVANLGEVKITADKATNSLVIQSSPRDFEVLKTIIRKLDIRRRQVFIEGAILEATVGKGFDYKPSVAGPLGLTNTLAERDSSDNVANKSGIIGALNGLGFDGLLKGLATDPGALTGMALGFRSGATYDVKVSDGNGGTTTQKLPLLSAIIQLSATNSNVNIISTPHILATANEEAMLSIGSEIPQNAGTTQTASGFSQANITRLKVATELTLTPQINQGDYLTLKIKERITDTGSNDKVLGITTINREASTVVIVKDQQTVVIGGLMRDKSTSNVTKVPILGDIPILGWLFKSTNRVTEKVNLLLFLTPYIIRNTGDMNDQFFRKLKEREGFLKEMGVEERKGVPSSGLTQEQMEMLDKEYVKSLQKKFTYPKGQDHEDISEKTEESKATAPIQMPVPAESAPAPKTEIPKVEPTSVPSPKSEVPAPSLAPTPADLAPIPVPRTPDLLIPPIPPTIQPVEPLKLPTETLKNEGSKVNEIPSKEWILEDSPPEAPGR